MFREDTGFSGYKRFLCSTCKKHKVLVSFKHEGKITCKYCQEEKIKLEKQNNKKLILD